LVESQTATDMTMATLEDPPANAVANPQETPTGTLMWPNLLLELRRSTPATCPPDCRACAAPYWMVNRDRAIAALAGTHGEEEAC